MIRITQNCWNKLHNLQSRSDKYGFIFSALSGGCNGFNYNLKLIDKPTYLNIYNSDNLKKTVLQNDITRVIVDPYSEMLLLGTTIDYINEDINNGIFESKFIYTRDKKYGTSCGCGVSFSLDN